MTKSDKLIQEEVPEQFYTSTGERIKRWWRVLERFSFETAASDVANVVPLIDQTEDTLTKDDQIDHGMCLEDPFVTVDAEDIDFFSEGDGRFNGPCTVHTKSGYVLGGQWVRGKRKGPGILYGPKLEGSGIKTIWGSYKDGVLSGKGRVEFNDEEETFIEGVFVDGKLDGRVCGYSNKTGLKFVGNCKAGILFGPSWKALHGGSFLYAVDEVKSNTRFTGDNIAYIYPDIETVLIGRFHDDVMIEARPSRVISCALDVSGILRLTFAQVTSDAEIFRFCPSTRLDVTCPLMLDDPFEKKVILARTSDMAGAGDGIFARVHIPANTTVAFYNGIRVKPGEQEPYPCSGYQIYVDWNKTSVITSDFMDIPPDFVSLDRYRASLGHKVNHSFEPNCRWGTIDHPTFGHVPRIVSIRDIAPGEELTTHYKLDMEEAEMKEHSRWYVRLWEEFSLKKKASEESKSSSNKVQAPEISNFTEGETADDILS